MYTNLTMIGLLLVGCNSNFQAGSSDVETATNDVSTQTSTACEATVRTISPASDGQANFYFRDNVVFALSEGADTAEVQLTTLDGTVMEGSTWIDDQVEDGDDLQVVFTPDEPLAPGTEYTATLDYCGGQPSVEFQTSALGTPIENPDALSGGTYTMDLSQAHVVKPGIAAQALLMLVDNHLALQVNGASDDTLDVTIAPTDAQTGLQDTCIPSLNASMPNNFEARPTFMVGPVDVPFTLAGFSMRLYDASASATFSADGSFFAGGTIAGNLDARDVVMALSGRGVLPSDSPEALCDIIGNAKLPCTACSDGEPYCLYLEVNEVSGHRGESGLENVQQTNCHVDCAESCDNEECDSADDFPVCSL
jgi:hypothetical protein